MPDLLLELFSEEIPARMQARAEADLARMMREALTQGGLKVGATKTYSGPRRIVFIAEGVPAQSAATVEERKGPRVGAPEKAVEGFLRAAGLKSLDQCQIAKDPKGDYYLARSEKPGRTAPSIIAEAVPEIVRKFPWPKSMRWGASRIRWIRPLHSILCLFDNKPVEFEVNGIKSGDITYGHRFLSGQKATQPKSLKISKNSDYAEVLLHAKVVSAGENRAKVILEGARNAASESGLALLEDHGLLAENAGLVEWPVVLSGTFDESFLDVPEEILMTSMKAHQKCFSLRDKKSEKLANRFILVSNLESEDGGKAIIAGNERVIRARLSDAKFFWKNDLGRPLEGLTNLLGQVTSTRSSEHNLSASSVSSASRASLPRWLARTTMMRSAPRISPRPISCPKRSANSPSCRASSVAISRSHRVRNPPSQTPLQSTTGHRGHPMRCHQT